jgi:hypothetical protein
MVYRTNAYLTRSLESHPLIDEVTFLGTGCEMDGMVFVITIHQILDDRVRFPDGKVVIVMVDYSGYTCVSVMVKAITRPV